VNNPKYFHGGQGYQKPRGIGTMPRRGERAGEESFCALGAVLPVLTQVDRGIGQTGATPLPQRCRLWGRLSA